MRCYSKTYCWSGVMGLPASTYTSAQPSRATLNNTVLNYWASIASDVNIAATDIWTDKLVQKVQLATDKCQTRDRHRTINTAARYCQYPLTAHGLDDRVNWPCRQAHPGSLPDQASNSQCSGRLVSIQCHPD